VKQLLGVVGAVILVAGIGAPIVLAQDGTTHTGRVLISTGGDVTIGPNEQADLVVVVNGEVTINGRVNTVVAVDGAATLVGAATETVVAVRSFVTLADGTRVSGDVFRLDSQVLQLGDAEIGGGLRDVGAELLGLGFIVGPVLLLFWLGFAIATIAAGLLAAALAARQVRAAEALISHEPVQTILAAIAATILPVLVIAVLFMTIVGAPLAIGIVLFLWPLVAFVGYLVAGIWVGDWILARLTPGVVRERPYLAAVIGIGLVQLTAVWPLLHFVVTFIGYGAVVLLAWRTFNAGRPATTSVSGAQPLPIAG
jgi:hypothetical protein